MYKRSTTSLWMPLLAVACAGYLASACSEDKKPEAAQGVPDAGGNDAMPGTPPVLIAERFSTPDGRVMYMGVFPQLPSQPIMTNQLTELSKNGKAFSCGGNAFFQDGDASSIRKFVINADYSLTEGPSIQLAAQGIEGQAFGLICVSPTQAFVINGSASRAVEWNPSTMTIVSAFNLPAVDIPAGLDPGLFEPFTVGALSYFPLKPYESEGLAVAPRAVVGVFDSRDKSMTYTYAEGCASGTSGFVAADGTFYRDASSATFEQTYGTPPGPGDCVLRIPAGQKQFDPAFKQVMGPTRDMFPVQGDLALALLIDMTKPLPAKEDLYDWYKHPVVPTLFNRLTGETSPYPGVPNVAPMNNRKLRLDGKNLYQLNTFDEEGRVAKTDVVELTPTGPSAPLLTIVGGDVLTIERVK